MTKALTIHNAQITTAAIEIQTLTIGGKQVTLAVFRQLEESPWLDASGDPRGTAWGRVNYCPGGGTCAAAWQSDGWRGRERGSFHLHIVWQCNDELRRSAFQDPESYYVADAAAQAKRLVAYRQALDLPQLFIAV
jgi:hypothetical protein